MSSIPVKFEFDEVIPLVGIGKIQSDRNNQSGHKCTSEPVVAKRKMSSRKNLEKNDRKELFNHMKSLRRVVTAIDEYDIVVGHEAVKDTIESAFISFNCLKEELDSALCVKTVLLVGVPGIGKTDIMCNIAARIAKIIKKPMSVFIVSAADILSKYMGESEKSVNALWDVVQHYSPSLVLFDEVDALMKSRNDDESEHNRRLKNQMLSQMDGSRVFKNVVTVAATNRGFDLDDAFLRRFKRKFFLRPPNADERVQILQKFLAKDIHLSNLHMSATDIQEFVKITQNFTGDDIKTAVCFAVSACLRIKQESESIPVKQLGRLRKHLEESWKCPEVVVTDLTVDTLLEAVREVVPSCKGSDLKRQIRWAKKHCKDSNYNRSLGYQENEDVNGKTSAFGCLACFKFL